MESEFANLNWLAVIVGTVVSFLLGMIWFTPKMFGRAWTAGMNDLKPPASLPIPAIILHLVGTFALALVIGITATQDMLITAILAILAVAILQSASGLFKQNSGKTVSIDAGYTIAMGAIMIIAQGIL
ncbi:MAG: DUF1761 domain-containing protein [Paracoccaceae bacterium]